MSFNPIKCSRMQIAKTHPTWTYCTSTIAISPYCFNEISRPRHGITILKKLQKIRTDSWACLGGQLFGTPATTRLAAFSSIGCTSLAYASPVWSSYESVWSNRSVTFTEKRYGGFTGCQGHLVSQNVRQIKILLSFSTGELSWTRKLCVNYKIKGMQTYQWRIII